MDLDHKALIETFRAEAEENLATIEEALVALETHPEDADLLHKIFRAAHTLKGNAAALELPGVAALAHSVENLLDQLRAGTLAATATLVTLLLQSVDALREMLPAALAGDHEPRPAHASLLKRLERHGRKRSRRKRKDEPVQEPSPDSGGRAATGRRFADVVGVDVRARTLRVGIEKLDRLLNLSGELAIGRGRVRQLLETGTQEDLRRVLEVHKEADQLYADLQELVMQVRMVAVGPMLRQYARTVRDQSGALGKQARLVLEGEDVEVDTKVIEYIHDPLMHMIRNALDHGIEPPEVRQARGKDPCGTITIRARHETGSVVFEVSDDGRGLDRAGILERARARGLVGASETLSDDQVHQLVFEPGFTTAETVTDLSGRGVGLDVVRKHVDVLRGFLAIDSREGEGATITARLPLTLAIIPGFGVGAGGETYLVPLECVMETLALPPEAQGNGGRGVINLRGEPLPYFRLSEHFVLGRPAASREHVVVVQHAGTRAGLAVDELYGESQTVIKPLGRLFQGLPGIAGSSVLGNGRVALILDVPALLREAVAGDTDG